MLDYEQALIQPTGLRQIPGNEFSGSLDRRLERIVFQVEVWQVGTPGLAVVDSLIVFNEVVEIIVQKSRAVALLGGYVGLRASSNPTYGSKFAIAKFDGGSICTANCENQGKICDSEI